MQTWEIKSSSKDLLKTPMLSLIWPVQERKLNTDLISSISTSRLLKELQRHVPKRVFTDWFISLLQELTKTLNRWISKQKPSDNKSSRKHSPMLQFSDHVQFMVSTTILRQICKDNHTYSGTILWWFTTTALLRNSRLRTVILQSVFWMLWKWRNQRYLND